MVGLEPVYLGVELSSCIADLSLDLWQSGSAVELRLPLSQQVEIGPVQHRDAHSALQVLQPRLELVEIVFPGFGFFRLQRTGGFWLWTEKRIERHAVVSGLFTRGHSRRNRQIFLAIAARVCAGVPPRRFPRGICGRSRFQAGRTHVRRWAGGQEGPEECPDALTIGVARQIRSLCRELCHGSFDFRYTVFRRGGTLRWLLGSRNVEPRAQSRGYRLQVFRGIGYLELRIACGLQHDLVASLHIESAGGL